MAAHQKERKLSLQLIIAIALGGAIGSVARYLVGIGSGKLFGLDFPWGTLIINIVGSFLIGAFVESFALRWELPQVARALPDLLNLFAGCVFADGPGRMVACGRLHCRIGGPVHCRPRGRPAIGPGRIVIDPSSVLRSPMMSDRLFQSGKRCAARRAR